MSNTEETQRLVEKWYNAITNMDIGTALSCLSDDVEWINIQPVAGISDNLPWIGTWRGADKAAKASEISRRFVDIKEAELLSLIVQGDEAVVITRESGISKATGNAFKMNQALWLKVDTSIGKIVRAKNFADPSPIIGALGGKK
jgi:ketosteroid isomerase-like protein